MSEELKDTCGVCTAFYSDRGGHDPGRNVPGQCRAKAPRAPNKWPKTGSQEWCRDDFKATNKHKMAKMRAAKGKKDDSEGTGSEE